MKSDDFEVLETKSENKIEIKTLTLPQIRELRKLGLDPAMNVMTPAKNAEMVDWILDNVYKDVVFETIPYNECMNIAIASYKKAYGREDELKNL